MTLWILKWKRDSVGGTRRLTFKCQWIPLLIFFHCEIYFKTLGCYDVKQHQFNFHHTDS